MADKLYTCKKCGKAMMPVNFYSHANPEKNDGKMDICKKCITMHINNYEPSTFLWILQEADVPFVQDEWDTILNKAINSGKPVNSGSIIGKYLSKMKLSQWKNYKWEDSARVQEELNLRKGLKPTDGEDLDVYFSEEELAAMQDFSSLNNEFGSNLPTQQLTAPSRPMEVDLGIDLTADDRKYLAIKWGKLYKPEEWVALEQLYTDIMASFDIQTATHIDYLKIICKTSLKMNQAIDVGDIDGFQKLSKMYDSLMKSAKFTAAQNKAEAGEGIDSIGELVALCEKEGFIPKFCTEVPLDVVDATLKDFQNYTYRLVTEEMGLGDMIESALKQMQYEESKEEGHLDENEDFLSLDEIEGTLKDAEIEDELDRIALEQEEDSYGTE